jgi:thymidylate synthase
MEEYQEVVERVLSTGNYKQNRTEVDTISSFGEHYEVDLDAGFPLLTTKQMGEYRWNSLVHEFLWYLSGDEHVRALREETGIWESWTDESGHVDTSYGRFWRRYPIPETGLPGEAWPTEDHRWTNDDERTFDQMAYILDELRANPNSRRLVLNAWHPANAAVSGLPPCHYSFVVNVQQGQLNVHLTQRSGDMALGVPFDIAAYGLLANVFARRTGLDLGTFSHTVVDAHVYCGKRERGAWYNRNLDTLKHRLRTADRDLDYRRIRDWIESEAPPEDEPGHDHVPGLLSQLSRVPREPPEVRVADKPIDDLGYDDFELRGYEAAPEIEFEVAV